MLHPFPKTKVFFGRSLTTQVVAVVLLNLFIFGMAGWSTYSSYQAQLKLARQSAQNLSLTLTQSINAALDKINAEMRSSAKEIERLLAAGALTRKKINKYLTEQLNDMPDANSLGITNASGRSLYEAAFHAGAKHSFLKMEFFQKLRDEPDVKYAISDPIKDGITGKHNVIYALRLNYPNGSFAGIIYALISIDLIANYFSELDLGSKGAVSLRKGFGDFAIIARIPVNIPGTKVSAVGNPRHSSTFADMVDRGAKNHVYEAVTGVDKIYRTWSVRRLEKFNYYIGLGLAHDDLFAVWNNDMRKLLLLSFLFTLISIFYARRAYQLKVARSNMFEVMESMARKDGLTEIPNRRRFDEVLKEEWLRARRDQRPLSLVMFDIDHFKAYNDHYGHARGDDCLKQVAQVLGEAARRSGDIVARYGGEEFVMLLPNTELQSAHAIAENIRQKIEALQLPHTLSDASNWVTISAGAYSMFPTNQDGFSELIENADLLLYEAKHRGRNRVYASTKDR